MPNNCSDDELPWQREAPDRLDTKYPYGEGHNRGNGYSYLCILLFAFTLPFNCVFPLTHLPSLVLCVSQELILKFTFFRFAFV